MSLSLAERAEAVLTTADGVRYLAPEVQLLFKSKDVRGKDDVDRQRVGHGRES